MKYRFQKFSLEDLEKEIPAILKSKKDNLGNYKGEHYIYWIRGNTHYYVKFALNNNEEEIEEANLFKKEDIKYWNKFFLETLGKKWDKSKYYIGFIDSLRTKKIKDGEEIKSIKYIEREYFITEEDIQNLKNYSLI